MRKYSIAHTGLALAKPVGTPRQRADYGNPEQGNLVCQAFPRLPKNLPGFLCPGTGNSSRLGGPGWVFSRPTRLREARCDSEHDRVAQRVAKLKEQLFAAMERIGTLEVENARLHEQIARLEYQLAAAPGLLTGRSSDGRRLRQSHGDYSWRRASMGSMLAARRAGYRPKTTPIATEMPNAKGKDAGTMTGRMVLTMSGKAP